jgi:hypothetical protein
LHRKSTTKRDSALEKSYTDFITGDKRGSVKTDIKNFGLVDTDTQKDGFQINNDNNPTDIEFTTIHNESIQFSRKDKKTSIHVKINLNN